MIEDDDVTASIYHLLLEEMQVCKTFSIFTDSEEGLKFIKESAPRDQFPELMFLDIKMEGYTGFELIEEVNNLRKIHNIKTKVVVLTSSTFLKDVEKARQLSVDDYVLKPLTREKILDLIKKISENKLSLK